MFWRNLGLDQVTSIEPKQKYTRDPSQPMESHAAIEGSSPQITPSWRGWSIGSYVHVLRPTQTLDWSSCNMERWQIRPALLIDIFKHDTTETEFLVVCLYDRYAAAQRSKGLEGYPRWRASVSLWAWPREYTYVLSDDFEIVYEWDLRVWSRSTPPSVAIHRTIDHLTSRLVRSDRWLETVLVGALSTKVRFRHFLCLPREIRDIIYEYALLDENRTTSTIHTNSSLSQRAHHEKRWPWQCSLLSIRTSTPPPDFNTPSILSVCRQVRCEALDALYRTKTLVITVTSTEFRLCGVHESWLPRISRFLRIRIDLIMACLTAEAMFECFRHVARLLVQYALSLQILEFRVGYSYASASAAVSDHGVALVISAEDVVASMGQLVSLVEAQNIRTSSQRNGECAPIKIIWGVNEVQRKAGDFSCSCSYVTSNCLRQMWQKACGASEVGSEDEVIQLLEQDCRHLGCFYHRQ